VRWSFEEEGSKRSQPRPESLDPEKVIPLAFVFLLFLSTGILCTGWPKLVREFTINACESGRWGFWIGRNMILRRVKKPGYLIELRVIGIVSLWAAVLLGWMLLAPKHY
jgi:hypothetical protein